MLHDVFPVPLTEDRREPTTIPVEAGQFLTNVYAWQGALRKSPGFTRFGAVQALGVSSVRNFLEGIFPDGTRVLMALAAGSLNIWNGTSWGSNLSGAAGRPAIPTPAYERFSLVNTLGYVYIVAGGNSNMLYYNGSFAVVPPADLVSPNWGVATVTNLTARVVLGFADRLILVRTVEDGVEFPTRIRWNALTNAAGAVALPQDGQFNTTLVGANLREITESTSEPLTGGFVLGERCFLTKAHEILELIPTGQPDPTFSVQSRVSGTGVLCPFSVAVVENIAFFIGTDNVYMFDGNTVQPVGDAILEGLELILFGSETDQLRTQGAINPGRTEYHILPSLLGLPFTFVFDYKRLRWSSRNNFASGDGGNSAIGSASGTLLGGGTSKLVYNGAPSRGRTTFIADESVTTRIDYSTATGGEDFGCQVTTRQFFPKRKGFRGVVEPVATDKDNILYEVDFKGVSNGTLFLRVTDTGGDTDLQTITMDAGGRGKAFFTFPWQCAQITFLTFSGTFRLSAVIGYRWGEGGFHLPTDPS